MPQIFISYSRTDRPIVEKLAALLSDAGYDVWWDASLLGGAQFEKEINAALSTAPVSIIAWSRNSLASDWVRAEAGAAHRLKTALPIVIDDTSHADLPLLYQQLHTIEMRRWSGSEDAKGYRELLEALAIRLGRPETATEPAPIEEEPAAKRERDAVVDVQPKPPKPPRAWPRWLVPAAGAAVLVGVLAVSVPLLMQQIPKGTVVTPPSEPEQLISCPANTETYTISSVGFCLDDLWDGTKDHTIASSQIFSASQNSNWLFVMAGTPTDILANYNASSHPVFTQTRTGTYRSKSKSPIDFTLQEGRLKYPETGLETDYQLYSAVVGARPVSFLFQIEQEPDPREQLGVIDSIQPH